MAVLTPTASVIVIGNEILSGRTQDININYIAKKLTSIGIKLAEVRVVADIESRIIEAVNALRMEYDYVFTTGGIGPTHDDITTDSVAKAFGVAVGEHAEAKSRLMAHYGSEKITPARLRMARIPDKALLIDNPVSSAPGFCLGNVYVLAGVPHIMQAMLDGIVSQLKHGPTIYSKSISGQVAESMIAEPLAIIAQQHPLLDIGSYPWLRDKKFGTALVVRGTDVTAIKAAVDSIYKMMLSYDKDTTIE